MSTRAKVVLVVTAVTLLGGLLRFVHLSQPHRKYFDEVYYASDGCLYAGYDYRDCGLDVDSERSWVHPPLGKALISWGIDPPGPIEGFGNTPFGWRVAAAAAGTATVGAVAALAFLLFGRALWAGAAGLLLATENLHFVQSRIAMLDVFLAFFVVLGFLAIVADRHRHERSEPGEVRPSDPEGVRHPSTVALGGVRPLRLLAGASFGAAVAVKWSGVFALAGAGILAAAWSIAAARRLRRSAATDRREATRAFVGDAAGQLVAFVLVPAVVYVVTWIPWLADRSFDVAEWWRHHLAMADYHRTLETVKGNGEPIHPYLSPAWSWLLMARPVSYYWQGAPNCCREVLGMGHPFLFWGSLVVIPYLALAWVTRREWRAGAVLVPILAQYLPWLFVSRPLFLFYMTPVTPFLVLGTTFLLHDLAHVPAPRRRMAIGAAVLVLAVSVGMFAFFWPILQASRITYSAWQQRIWMFNQGSVFNWV